jgi:hypothetical protein
MGSNGRPATVAARTGTTCAARRGQEGGFGRLGSPGRPTVAEPGPSAGYAAVVGGHDQGEASFVHPPLRGGVPDLDFGGDPEPVAQRVVGAASFDERAGGTWRRRSHGATPGQR